jgi:SlyX protein
MEQDRVTELEIRFSHQEIAIEKLQERVYEQDTAIQNLELVIKAMKARLEAIARGEDLVGPADEKPPHY